MTQLKGRAATPVRPGLVCKEVLLGNLPLITGETVHESSIIDLHRVYMDLIRRENTVRIKAKRLRGMTYHSFLVMFKFAQLLNLVVLVREEDMEFPPPSGNLYSIRKDPEVRAVISKKRIFKLTDIGAEDERSWGNLTRAWKEGWTAPAKAEYVTPLPTRYPTEEERVELVTPYTWHDDATLERIQGLAVHLREMAEAGIKIEQIALEASLLRDRLTVWLNDIDETAEEMKSVGYKQEVRRLGVWFEHVGAAQEMLEKKDLVGAAEELEKIVR